MARALRSLDSLRVLAACVRHGNFSQAAAELGITPTAVSQRMRLLEQQLGVKLFQRHGPRLITTDRAKALGARLDHALALMRTALDDARRVRQPLRVTCAPTFAARWLVPRLGIYHSLPGSQPIVLDASQTVLRRGAFDVAIRSAPAPEPGYTAMRLLCEQGTPMLSPKWLAGGKRFSAGSLLRVPLIPDPRWPAWFKLAGVSGARAEYVTTRFPNYELESQAAVRGIGAALLSPTLFGELCADALLVAPFPWVVSGPSSYWLLWANDAPEPHFVAWLKAQFHPQVPTRRTEATARATVRGPQQRHG
jgi:LysR family transcriptional regulator, glycine cleavage system transcriptional activator